MDLIAKGRVIRLTAAEMMLARFLARRRHQMARAAGRPNLKVGNQADSLTDLEGIGAEIAFAKLTNTYPDLDLGHTPVADTYLPDGRTVDVKTTKYPTGRLLAVKWKTTKVDLFALMIGPFPEYRFAGAMNSHDLLRPERITNLGHGDGFAATQDQLEHLVLNPS